MGEMTHAEHPWWLGLAPAQAAVRCNGHTHRLRWEAGRVLALDHDDPSGERALAALGGERCACTDLLDTWQAHERDALVLALASRGPTDLLAAQDDEQQRAGAQVRRRRPTAAPAWRAGTGTVHVFGQRRAGVGATPTGGQSELALGALLTLGGGLPDRLVATVAAHWRRQLLAGADDVAGVRAQLSAALYGRVLASLRPWRGSDGGLDLRMVPEGAEPVARERDGAAQLELPFGWIGEVWARGLAIVWGRFCVSARSDDGLRWALATVGPDLGAPATITLQLPPA
jgi:hypothetical protein